MIFLCCILSVFFFSLFKPGNTCNSETQFLVEHKNGSTSCEDCEPCPPGQTLSIKCGKRIPPSAMINCEPCKLGMSFSSKYGTSVCSPCSPCAKDQVVVQNCTLTQDIKCGKRCYGKDRYYLLINKAILGEYQPKSFWHRPTVKHSLHKKRLRMISLFVISSSTCMLYVTPFMLSNPYIKFFVLKCKVFSTIVTASGFQKWKMWAEVV